jgi:uncharacterized protein YjeT (DUF2065 family)
MERWLERGMSDPGVSRDGGGARGIDRAVAIVTELADAFGAALIALSEEQGLKLADRASAIGDAAGCAARSLDASDIPKLARGMDQAARSMNDVARLLHERNWREIVSETASLARRRPRLFGLGMVAIGLLAGRLLALRLDRDGLGKAPRMAAAGPGVEGRRGKGVADAIDGRYDRGPA